MRSRVWERLQDINLQLWIKTIYFKSLSHQQSIMKSWIEMIELVKEITHLLWISDWMTKKLFQQNQYWIYTENEDICFEKRKQQRFYLNINCEITKSDLNQTSNSYLTQYMHFQKKSWAFCKNIWTKTKKKNLFRNLNH